MADITYKFTIEGFDKAPDGIEYEEMNYGSSTELTPLTYDAVQKDKYVHLSGKSNGLFFRAAIKAPLKDNILFFLQKWINQNFGSPKPVKVTDSSDPDNISTLEFSLSLNSAWLMDHQEGGYNMNQNVERISIQGTIYGDIKEDGTVVAEGNPVAAPGA